MAKTLPPIDDIRAAIAQGQFEVWFQPRLNPATGARLGTDALLRWRHPTEGLIPAEDFIPALEQNGSLCALSSYLWEEACRALSQQISKGEQPLPITVYVSRLDLAKKELPETLTALTRRYGVPANLLCLRIYRSAFMQTLEQLTATVRELQDCGFAIGIGDTGDGSPSALDSSITAYRDALYKLKLLTDSIPGGLATFELSPDSARMVYFNEGFYRFSGYSREEYARLASDNPLYQIFEEDRSAALAAIDRLRQGVATTSVGSYRCHTKDGGYRWFSLTGTIAEKHGDSCTVNVVKYDITEQKQTEQRLRDADAQLRLMTNNIPGGIATYACMPGDLSTEHVRITYFNDGFCKLFGMTREEYQKQSAANPAKMIFQQDRRILSEQFSSLLTDGTPIDCVYRAHVKGGGFKWISHKAEAVAKHDGEVIVNAMLLDVTERQSAIESLRVSEEENRLAVCHSGNIIGHFDIPTRVLTITPEVAQRFGVAEELTEVPYGQVRRGGVSQESQKAYVSFYEEIIHGGVSGEAVFQFQMPEGWRWQEAHYSTVFADDGTPSFAVVSFLDVTERLEKETVYKKWQQSLHEKNPEAYTLFRCNLSKNASFDTMEGSLLNVQFSPEGVSFNDRTEEYVSQCVYPEDQDRYRAVLNSDTLLAGYYRGRRYEEMEYRELLPAGGVRWLRLTIELVEYPNSTDVEAYLMYEDIDSVKKAELQTKERAETDPLTGVLNRNAFAEQMEGLLAQRDGNALHALFMMDLDGFKLVNDSFGHAVGDQTLIEIAQKLTSAVRAGDLVCRLGGDEFMVCLRNIPTKDAVTQKAKQIGALLRKSFSLEVQMSGSIGIALAPEDGGDFDTLYHKADLALYHVKATGKDSFCFYAEGLSEKQPRPETAETAPVNAASPLAVPKRRMLVVEDNKVNSAFLQNMFENDFIVDTVSNGSDALIRMRRYGAGISVVLLDLIMPGMDGFSVLLKMRESPEMHTIPVIVVSGMEERETSLQAIRYGAFDYITKPVDAELLRLRVQSAISKSENERLQAQNRFLALQNDQVERYRSVLESDGTTLAEYSMANGTFTYDKTFGSAIAGHFDSRSLWEILVSDQTAAQADVDRLKKLVAEISTDVTRISASIQLSLATPQGEQKPFRVKAVKRTDDFNLGGKIVLAFTRLQP